MFKNQSTMSPLLFLLYSNILIINSNHCTDIINNNDICIINGNDLSINTNQNNISCSQSVSNCKISCNKDNICSKTIICPNNGDSCIINCDKV